MKKILFVLIFIVQYFSLFAADTLVVHENESKFLTRQYFVQLVDHEGSFSINDVIQSKDFRQPSSQSLPFLKYSDSLIWVKFVLLNKTRQPYIPISINSGVIESFDLYFVGTNSHHVIHLENGGQHKYGSQMKQTLNNINCTILPDSARTIYLRIKSNDSMAFPVKVDSADRFIQSLSIENVTIGLFVGVVLIMALYNLLLFILVKDLSYLYYVFYIIFLGLNQALTRGLGNDFLSGDRVFLNDFIIPGIRVCFWFSILLFVQEFLQLRKNLKLYHKYYNLLYVLVFLPVLALIFKKITFVYQMVTLSAFAITVSLLAIGVYLYVKGFRPAKFFMFGWSIFFVTVLISIARNKGLISYNSFTANLILYSAGLELLLFSAALADRINFYREQHNESQLISLTIAKENERLITGQNIALENMVKERTQELIQSNQHLSVSIENLKAAQMQLVDTEKMASLGQLTAGIAHEINNPINFVSANVKPLRLDLKEIFALLDKYEQIEGHPDKKELIKDINSYKKQIDIDFIKQEVETLLEGIEEGASRTTEIVQSLRTFSRTDEVALKPIDINRAILNTLVLLRSTIPYYIEIKPVFDKLPLLNCYPGKINQVLINLINNSIQAIKSKPEPGVEHILISTTDYPDNITIEITDTGIGMTDKVKQRVFDPFFTTKDIGEGTGLGLSIVFGIIEKHHGAIEVKSVPGEGTTFTVMLPKTLE